MPVVSRSTSIAANATNNNILAGSAFEYLPGNAALSFGIVQNSANLGDLLVTVQSGSDVLQEDGPVTVFAGMPRKDVDFILSDVALGGERIIIKVRNTTAGAIILNTTLNIDFL